MKVGLSTTREPVRHRFLILWVLAILSPASIVCGQTTSFTYQGRFTDGGAAANGTYEMQFKLFDGAGSQVGSTITNGAVQVNSGVFAVQLDFGAAAFPGTDRFLEIGVRSAGSGEAYTVLAPRQQLTSAVYAIRAGSTTTADTATSATTATNATQLGGVAANQYVLTSDSRLLDARTPTAGSANYIQNTVSQQTANFNIAGNGTAGGILSANLVNATTQYNIDGKHAFSVTGDNTYAGRNVGTNGDASTFYGAFAGATTAFDGKQNSFFGFTAGFENTVGFQNSFLGSQAGRNNTTGSNNTFVGTTAGNTNFSGSSNTALGAFADLTSTNLSNATAIGFAAQVSQSNSLVLGGIKGVGFGAADTNVGIGTPAPAYRLTVKTAAGNYGVVHTDGTVSVGSYVGGSTGGGWFGTKSNHSLSFFVNDGSPSMTIETGGTVKLNTLGAAGSTQLCRNAANQISTCSSSLRYKTNIQPFIGGLSILNRLRPITFDWKQGGLHDLGFGAEDIAAIEPLLVTRNEKGEVEGVKYDRISAVLVNAVKEQQGEIEAQRLQITQQQTELSVQRREIEELKRLVARNLRPSRRRSR